MSFVDRDYRYRFVNDTYARYAKRPRHEIIGLTVAELLGQEAFERAVKPHLDRCFEGENVHYQAWFDVPQEGFKYMDVGYYPVYDDEHIAGAVVNSRDITSLAYAKEALHESEVRLELAIEGSDGGRWHIPLDPDDTSGALPDEIYLSPRLKGFIGYEDSEFPNSLAAWESRVHPDDLDMLRERSRRYRRGQMPAYDVEYRVMHKDGSVRWLHTRGAIQRRENGWPLIFAGIDWDVTARKTSEEVLRRERDLVTRIMETSPVGIVVLDREGRITFVNALVQQVTGLSREQIALRPYNDPTWLVVGDNDQPLSNDQLPFPRVMRSGEAIRDLRQEIELPGGRKLLLSMNAAPLLDTEGDVDGVVITINDVTEQARMHEQIQQYAAELEQRVAERTAELEASQVALLQAERLAIAGKLAASLTHEISNPLQSVIGCLGLAEEARAEGQDVGAYLDIALVELRRVARIVARLRNLGHPPSELAVKEPTDLPALLEQVLGLCRKKCQEQGIEIEVRVEDPLALPLLVRDQIEQVWLNLALNAIDAMPDGGRLSVHASLAEAPAGWAGQAEQGGIEISFADSGAGIPAHVLPQIFDPFYSTKPENLGLGLSICQDIVEQHGGHIAVESQPGQGSRFTLWLPLQAG
jgi:PAS domain S-box-containing protein